MRPPSVLFLYISVNLQSFQNERFSEVHEFEIVLSSYF